MFEQAFKNIDEVLWKEAGCTQLPSDAFTAWTAGLGTSGSSERLSEDTAHE